ncbi:MAG: DUF5694 domain-containing protein [Mizugakiibacter sp.]|uniref:DUF5694 domain-containing protein n=1 Tax=Mizugakiibacter sp. TaxID=1972610 RepID=UPI0031C3503B|nr:DUF5694 domain-containing protein [Xanthomonadaceae bacterium]
MNAHARTVRPDGTRRCRTRLIAVALLVAQATLLPAWGRAAEAMIVGTPHLGQLRPAPSAEQRQLVIDRLAKFAPTLVCVEAMPGDRVKPFVADPGRYGELLGTFAMDAVRLAPEQQVRWSVDADAALRAARELERRPGELDLPARGRLIGLQLAGYEPWSALLNWSYLNDAQQAEAGEGLGRQAVERLRTLSASANEIVSLAIPLARRQGHRRLCMVDSFADELAVQPLEEDLLPILQDAAVARGIEAFNARQAAHWHADRNDGLSVLMRWVNSDEFAVLDRRAQWDVFDGAAIAHDAGKRRLALWHARNADIAAYLYRALASDEGARTVLLIGASHRPFIERALRAQPWIEVRPAAERLAP